MEGARQALTLEEIIEFNRTVIEKTGEGSYNPRSSNLLYPNANTLHHVLETLDAELFGQPRYTTIFDKAAAIVWAIIKDHAFGDGCKRTGMFSLRVYMRLQGFVPVYTTKEATEIAVRIANTVETGITKADVRDWIETYFVPEIDVEITTFPTNPRGPI